MVTTLPRLRCWTSVIRFDERDDVELTAVGSRTRSGIGFRPEWVIRVCALGRTGNHSAAGTAATTGCLPMSGCSANVAMCGRGQLAARTRPRDP